MARVSGAFAFARTLWARRGEPRRVDVLHPAFATVFFVWTALSPKLAFPAGALYGWALYAALFSLVVVVPRLAGTRLAGGAGHVHLAVLLAFLLVFAGGPIDPALSAVAVLLLVIVYGPGRGRPGFAPGDVLYRFSPVILAAFLYVNLRQMSLPTAPADEFLIALDRSLFTTDLTVWAERLYHPLLSEWFAFHYAIYLTFPVLTPLLLYRPSRFAWFEEYVFCFALAMNLGCIGYLGVPGSGPHDGLASVYANRDVPGLWLTAIQWPLIERYRFPFDAFPSMHTANVILCTWILFRAKSPVAWLFVFLAINVLSAILYLRMHYTVDVVAGLLLALSVAAVGPLLSRTRTPPTRTPGSVSTC